MINNLIQKLVCVRNRYLAKTPLLLQIEYTECGAVALGIVLSYYGLKLPIEKLRDLVGITRDGSNAHNIIIAAESLGCKATGYSVDIADLNCKILPLILFWEFNHFVVLEYFDDRYFYINDPAVGHRRLALEDFNKSFTGVVLSIKPDTTFCKQDSTYNIAHYVFNLFKSEKKIFYILFGIIILTFIPIIQSGLTKLFIDKYLLGHHRELFFTIVNTTTLIGLFSILLSTWLALSFNTINFKLIILNVSNLCIKMLDLPLKFFYQRNSSDIVLRLDSIRLLSRFVLDDISKNSIGVLTFLTCFILMFLINLQISVCLFLLLGCVLSLRWKLKGQINEYNNKNINYSNAFYSYLVQSFKYQEQIQMHSMYQYVFSKTTISYLNYITNSINFLRINNYVNTIEHIMNIFTKVIIFCYGGYQVSHGYLTLGMLITYNSIYILFNAHLESIMILFNKWQNLKPILLRLLDTVNYQYLSNKNPYKLTNIHSIRLEQVYFKHSKLSQYILRDINIDANNVKKQIALVGANGSGKSTIIKILIGLLQPTKGVVKVNNNVINNFVLSQVGYVSQHINVFKGTIFDNLTLFKKDISYQRIEKVLNALDLGNMLPRLHHEISEFTISGGEKQRLEIARVLLREPQIIVIDEGTSALDVYTEKKVLNLIADSCSLIFHVTHKQNVIDCCDHIYHVEHGHIVKEIKKS